MMTRFARHLGAGGAVHNPRPRRLAPPLWRKIVDPIATYFAVVIALLLLISILLPR
jgi:hypothetical protein